MHIGVTSLCPIFPVPSWRERCYTLAKGELMGGFNWLDTAIIILLLTGMVIGFRQGLIRQLIGFAALYAALVLATEFFRGVSQVAGDALNTAPNTLTNAAAFFLVLFVAMGIINFFGQDAYKSTKIHLVPFLDQITGLVLGVVSMWIILSIAMNVIMFAVNTQAWPGTAEIARNILKDGIEESRISPIASSTLPMIVSTIRPWLPGGLPAIFDL